MFAGKTTDLYLIPTKAGTYELVCEIEGHFEAGMFGTITVTVARDLTRWNLSVWVWLVGRRIDDFRPCRPRTDGR